MIKRGLGIFLALGIMMTFSACGDGAVITGTGEVVPGEVAVGGSADALSGEAAVAGSEDALSENTAVSRETVASKDGVSSALTETEPAQSPEPTEPPVEEIKITISAAGDVTLGSYIGQGYAQSFPQIYKKVQDKNYFFENVKDIFSEDDMTLVNLEGPLTTATEGNPKKKFCISGDPEYAEILTLGSVEAVSMANNHRMDYYEQGTQDTQKALDEQGIFYAFNENTAIYETKGVRIGYVSVNEVGDGVGVEKYLEEGIKELREDEADLILTCCHWGIERDNYPEDYQRELGKKCIDWGADIVIGCHPHVIQGIEEYQGKYIVYSLGNFCFGANRNPPDKDCIIYQQTFTFLNGERQESTEVRVIPCSVSSVKNANDYKPTPSDGEDAQRIIDRMNEYSKDFGVTFDKDGYVVTE